MPKIAYSEAQREQIRQALIVTGFELMTKQGIQHTTVEQIYKKVGISRTFFYSFFPTKEDLIVEALYLQQPKLIAYAQNLMDDPSLNWREAVKRFLYSACYGEKSGIIVLTMEEQQLIFKRLSEENYRLFREKQFGLFNRIFETFGVRADTEQVQLLLNLFLAVIIICRALPDTLPMFVPEEGDKTVEFQVESILNYLESLKK